MKLKKKYCIVVCAMTVIAASSAATTKFVRVSSQEQLNEYMSRGYTKDRVLSVYCNNVELSDPARYGREYVARYPFMPCFDNYPIGESETLANGYVSNGEVAVLIQEAPKYKFSRGPRGLGALNGKEQNIKVIKWLRGDTPVGAVRYWSEEPLDKHPTVVR